MRLEQAARAALHLPAASMYVSRQLPLCASPFVQLQGLTVGTTRSLPVVAALTPACACSVDTSKLDAGMGGAVADVYDKDAWAARLTEQDRLYQEALEAFTASQKPSAVQPAE